MTVSSVRLNPLNYVLYKNENENSPITANSTKREIKVQIYNSEGNLELISAYNFHPDKTNWWKWIIYSFLERIRGNTTVLVAVRGEPSALYVRIDDLSRILNVPANKINKKAIANDATQYVSAKQMKATINKVRLASKNKIVWNKTHQQNMETLIGRVSYPNICHILDSKEPIMDPAKIANLLVNIGKELNRKHESIVIDRNPQIKQFGYTISLPDIYLWKITTREKIKINLTTLVSSRENIQSPDVDLARVEFEHIVSTLGYQEDAKDLQTLAKKVGYSNLLSIIGHLEASEKIIMMNTFVAIGKSFGLPKLFDWLYSFFRVNYHKKEKDSRKNVISHAFAINGSDIFINQRKFDEGSFKIISSAIRLKDLSVPFIRIKTKKKEETGNFFQDLFIRAQTISQTKLEARLLDKLNKTNNPYLMLPYLCEIKSEDGRALILFQKKYDGVGTQLKTAPVFHQLAAIIDYAKGLSLLHKSDFVHMDCKPPNMLLEGDLNDQRIPVKAKVSDFGTTVAKNSIIKGGTPAYLPPEVFQGNTIIPNVKATPKMDSYSLGVTIYEIIMNKQIDFLLSQLSDNAIDQLFANEKTSLCFVQSLMLSVSRSLLRQNPQNRISCEKAVRELVRIQQQYCPVPA